jgi:translation elongation factor EF-1beta
MTMKINIKDEYLDKFQMLMKQMPDDAVVLKQSLDEEIEKRVREYRSGNMKTTPLMEGLDEIKKNLLLKL